MRLVARHRPLPFSGSRSGVHVERRRVLPQRLAFGLEVTRVHEVQAVVQVHLELTSAVMTADPARRILQERLHLSRWQAYQPLETDRSGPGLLHADRRGELGPHPRELFEDFPAARALYTTVEQVALQIRLDDVPPPRGKYCGAPCIMASSP